MSDLQPKQQVKQTIKYSGAPGLGFLVGPPLMAGLVGPVPVAMVGVLAEDRLQVPFVVDEHPVGAGEAGGSDGEPIVHSDCLAEFAGHDGDTQS